MTDRINALTVVLDQDIRTDDVEPLVRAITQFRGVQSVNTHVVELSDHIAFTRARVDLGTKLWRILYPKEKQS